MLGPNLLILRFRFFEHGNHGCGCARRQTQDLQNVQQHIRLVTRGWTAEHSRIDGCHYRCGLGGRASRHRGVHESLRRRPAEIANVPLTVGQYGGIDTRHCLDV